MKVFSVLLMCLLFTPGMFFPKSLSVSLLGGAYSPLGSLSMGMPLLTRDLGVRYDLNSQWSFSFEQRVYGHLLWSAANRHSIYTSRLLLKNFRGIAGLSFSGNGTLNFQLSVDAGLRYKILFNKRKLVDFEWINYIFPDSVISELETTFVFNDFFHFKNFAFLLEIQTHVGIYSFSDFAPGVGLRIGGRYTWKGL